MSAALAGEVNISTLPIKFNTAKNTMYFHDKGWFSSTDYPIRYFGGSWHWQAPSGQWVSLLTPFITKWNDSHYLILDRSGRIVVSSKDNSDNFEIRLINGEWSTNLGGEWTSLDSLYDY
jgi:hypothetical protein